jgi:DNA-binding response OmpR family regulator
MYNDVLLIDDEATFRGVIARNLRTRGLTVREAETVDEAIAEIDGALPDALLLDLNLPDRTGWDVLRELRQRQTHVPTIIVSAIRVPASKLEEFQPLAYLPKPFPLEALLRLLIGPEPGTTGLDEEHAPA